MVTITYQDAKEAFIKLYGNGIFNPEFETFDDAFLNAWRSFDYVPGAYTPEEFAEGMTECWQLTEG